MLKDSIQTSLLDNNIVSNQNLQHKLLVNNKDNKIINEIERLLNICDEFKISVAFITKSGVSLLKNVLKELEVKGVKGEIITGNYQMFTDPYALMELNNYSNIEVKMLEGENLHTKGFFFKVQDKWDIIIGSSNLTGYALTTNKEWNIKLSSRYEGKIAIQILDEFNKLWNSSKSFNKFINNYKELYDIERIKKNEYLKLIKKIDLEYQKVEIIKPNKMQNDALESLKSQRGNGKDKSLIISATGTGKTFLAAFDVKEYKPGKLLFIIHRENIAIKAMESFKKIIPNVSMGLYTGTKKENTDYLFCTIQTLNNNLEIFNEDEFDYIIVDEVHHGGAKTYNKVISYFKPRFLLGLTATPERSDDFNIYEMFDYNIAYEIRLREAYQYNLLTPFHYFGVSEVKVDDNILSDSKEDLTINNLTSTTRVKNIIEKISYYGHCGTSVKGLMFVSNVEEAYLLSTELNKHNLRTKALSGRDSESIRQEAIDDLENDKLDYLITVDIFNEGIDIPCVNQVVLLRPTQSSIIYIQQLGRGLRKYKDKEYVVIIDFIGNYKKNFLIPVALSGDNTYDKDLLVDNVLNNGLNIISGPCVLQFEEVAKDLIFNNITKENFSKRANILHDYNLLKMKLNKIPSLVDFYENKLISPQVILGYKNTYIEVKDSFEKEISYEGLINNKSLMLYLEYVSQKIVLGKRIEEIKILSLLLKTNQKMTKEEFIQYFKDDKSITKVRLINALEHLSKNIFTSHSPMYKFIPLIIKEGNKYILSTKLKEGYEKNQLFKNELDDLMSLHYIVYNVRFKDKLEEQKELLIVGDYYSKEEAFKYNLLDYNNGYQLQGYTVFKEKKIAMLFITFENDNYDNIFDGKTINWYSKNNRTVFKKDKLTGEGLVAHHKLDIQLFIKKKNNVKFTYMGKVKEVLKYKEENKQVECLFRI